MPDQEQKQQEQPKDEYAFGPEPRPENPWVKRTIGREAFYLGAERRASNLVKNGEPRCFIIRRPQRKFIHGGFRMWLRTGGEFDTGAPKAIPFYDDLEPWLYLDKKKGPKVSTLYPPEDRVLGNILANHPKLIAQQFFKGEPQSWPSGDPKLNLDEFYAIEVFEVLFAYKEVPDTKYPGGKRKVIDVDPATKKAKFTVNPRPYIWEMRRPWWDQLHNKILSPKFAFVTEVADPDQTASTEKPKELPSTDVSKIILKLWAKTKDPNEVESEKNVRYDVDFSATMTFDSSTIVPEDPLPEVAEGEKKGLIDWEQVYPQADPVEVKKLLDRLGRGEIDEDPEAPAGAEQAPPSDGSQDPDCPF